MEIFSTPLTYNQLLTIIDVWKLQRHQSLQKRLRKF